MKVAAVFRVAALFAGAYAQGVHIASPVDGSTISTGNLKVQVNRPSTLTSSTEVAIVISIAPCNLDGTCTNPAESLGQTLYYGPYHPQYPQQPTGTNYQPEQTFSVTVNDTFAGQKALLSVVHLSLAGTGPFPLYQILNATVHVK